MGKKEPITHCRNCGTKLAGDYCHVCGQSAEEPRRAVIGLVQDVFVETLAIDGKLIRTLALLFARPGRLARRYIDGKRVHYSTPFRLYLFTSVFFFLIGFSFIGDGSVNIDGDGDENAIIEVQTGLSDNDATNSEDIADAIGDAREALDEASIDNEALDESLKRIEEDPEAAAEAAETAERRFRDSTWEDVDFDGPAWLEPHAKKLYDAGKRVADDPRLFFAQTRENLPRVLLLAPVIYTLLLLLLYVYRRKYLVYDHFIVSLYMHAALYAYLLAAMLISKIPLFGFLWFVPIVWGAAQPLLVFRQAYGSNWFSVVVKWMISNFLYLASVTLIFTLGLTFSLYQS